MKGTRLGRIGMDTVIFASAHSSCRSVMAAAFFDRYADPSKAFAISAGIERGLTVNPEVMVAMKEVGLDLPSRMPRLLTEELAHDASMVIAAGCGDECPTFPGVDQAEWPLQDPRGQAIEDVRRIRDDVRDRVQALIASNGWA